ncbi:MAG: hypothetical protein AAF530_24145 [Pseudomonadota bacterium]
MTNRSDFEAIADRQREAQQKKDFDDHQNSMAGRDTGRLKRTFTGAASRGPSDLRNKLSNTTAQMSTLDMLLTDPLFAARHATVSDLLAQAENSINSALAELQNEIVRVRGNLQDTLDNANRLPDGTRVFRDADGNVYTEAGRLVGAEEVGAIEWKENAPLYEDFLRQKNAVETLVEKIERLMRFRIDVLGKARHQLNDPDDPPSLDDLDEIEKDIREASARIFEHDEAIENTPEETHRRVSNIKLPLLGN